MDGFAFVHEGEVVAEHSVQGFGAGLARLLAGGDRVALPHRTGLPSQATAFDHRQVAGAGLGAHAVGAQAVVGDG